MKQIKKLKNLGALIIILGFVTLFGYQIAKASINPETPMVQANFTDIALKARPGVVNIRTFKNLQSSDKRSRNLFNGPLGRRNPLREFFGPFSGRPSNDFKRESMGSGFIIDQEGYIVTNNHVIENADQIKVKLANEKEYDAELIGRDPNTDLALIKIPESNKLVPLNFGNSDNLQVGKWVVAIGSPFGLEQTVTAGIVSAKGRVIGSGPYDDFIQTDASINPGNSGGPLLNMEGKVVGINTAIIRKGQGVGFAIPANMAEDIIIQLKKNGKVTRGWLGLGIQKVTPELAEYYGLKDKKGVLVTEVYKGDPADKGGFELNDVITRANGKVVNTTRELSLLIANSQVGKKTSFTVFRDNNEKTLYAKLEKRPDSARLAAKEKGALDDFGLQLVELNWETARQYNYNEKEKGLLVVSVEPGSKGYKAGIRQGDLLVGINRVTIESLRDYEKMVHNTREGNSIHLLLKRGKRNILAAKVIK